MTNAYAGRIPDWNSAGLLPPFLGNPASPDRSPYRASLSDTMVRFGSEGEGRRELLAGLLYFRAALHEAGLTMGFQWIDGSFVEDVESLRERAPVDIDVVTFYYMPEGHATEESFDNAFPDLSNPFAMKWDFGIHAHLVAINLNDLETVIRRVAYWHDVWSHARGGPRTREGTRKGYVQVDLDPSDDESARVELDRMNRENGGLT